MFLKREKIFKSKNGNFILVSRPSIEYKPGNSGGSLTNKYGEFIGLVSWGIGESETINFAIDINSIKSHIEDILEQLAGSEI